MTRTHSAAAPASAQSSGSTHSALGAVPSIIPADQFWPGSGTIRRATEGNDQIAFIGCRNGERFLFTVPFDKHDAGRSLSRRPRQSKDCTVRALATAASAPYDVAYDALMKSGRKAARGFDIRAWARTAEFNGFRFAWLSFPAVKGQWRVNPVTFALAFPQGRFILRVAGHVLACVDGRVSDICKSSQNSCVYGALALIPTELGGEP